MAGFLFPAVSMSSDTSTTQDIVIVDVVFRYLSIEHKHWGTDWRLFAFNEVYAISITIDSPSKYRTRERTSRVPIWRFRMRGAISVS